MVKTLPLQMEIASAHLCSYLDKNEPIKTEKRRRNDAKSKWKRMKEQAAFLKRRFL